MSVYQQFNFNRSYHSNALVAQTLDSIRSAAPSVFAVEKHESRSERYAYIPTVNVVEALLKEGFVCTRAFQGLSRIPGKADFTKHLLTFTRESDLGRIARVGDSVRQVLLKNSHDGTCAYELSEGRYRWTCANGLMVAAEQSQFIKVPHKGDVVGRVIEGTYTVIDNAAKTDQAIERYTGISLDAREQEVYARSAMLLRWDGADDAGVPVAAPVKVEQVLRARRQEDTAGDLWTTFNRVQENLVRGGIHGRNADYRRMTTRPVKGIDQNLSLNRALWSLTESMAAIKAAA